jgi:hypothetical protein
MFKHPQTHTDFAAQKPRTIPCRAGHQMRRSRRPHQARAVRRSNAPLVVTFCLWAGSLSQAVKHAFNHWDFSGFWFSLKPLVFMVLLQRIELWTSPLPRECSTSELQQRRARVIRRKLHPVQGQSGRYWLAAIERHHGRQITPTGKDRVGTNTRPTAKGRAKGKPGPAQGSGTGAGRVRGFG